MMMNRQSYRAEYVAGPDFQAVELPYFGGEVSMVVIMPERLEAFERDLDAQGLAEILYALRTHEVDLSLPRFEFESEFSLSEALKSLGMPLAFASNADFSGMNGEGGLRIAAVLHKAVVNVDEEGTEAAAATAVTFLESNPPPATMTVNRPFLFLIRDRPSGTLLFIGRVVDPTA